MISLLRKTAMPLGNSIISHIGCRLNNRTNSIGKMKRVSIVLGLSVLFAGISFGQDKGKLIKFSNITEVTFGFQVGKTTQLTSLPGGGESTNQIAGYKFPAPRVGTSFGMLVGSIFFLGPGIAYTFQPNDDDGTWPDPNADQHKVSAFGHMRIHFARGKFRPYTELKGGYTHIFTEDVSTVASTFSAETYTWDGVFAEPAIGFGIKLGGHGQINISLGYQFLNVWNRSEGFTSADAFGPEIRDSYHRFLLSLGFSFY